MVDKYAVRAQLYRQYESVRREELAEEKARKIAEYKAKLDYAELKKSFFLLEKPKVLAAVEKAGRNRSDKINKAYVSLVNTSVDVEKESAELNQLKERNRLLLADYVKKLDEIYDKKTEKAVAKITKKAEACESLSVDKPSKSLSAAHTMQEGNVLEVVNLSKRFGGLKAVDGLSFNVKKGEIFGLIGPNGAGKTTVFNCLTRVYKSEGEIYFKTKSGETVSMRDYAVHDVVTLGMVRTFQNVEVVRESTVLDNLVMAAHSFFSCSIAAQVLRLPVFRIEEKIIRAKALKIIDFLGLNEYADAVAWGLPYGVLKKIEIARTLMCDPQLIILDEPAAGLNESETRELAETIKRIKTEYDCTILLVEHDMGLVMDICDTVCAISFGKLLCIGTPEVVQADKNVQTAYLGVGEE